MYGINCGVSILAIKIGFCDRLYPHQTAILKFMKFGSLEKNFYPIIRNVLLAKKSMLDPFNPLARVYEKIHDSVEDWNRPAQAANQISNVAEQVVDFLNEVDGMTQAHSRDFKKATPRFTLRDGSVLKMWKNPVGVNHVFIADTQGNMVFGGFVGWIHADGLNEAIAAIRRNFT
jgi:hypothetical protein